MKALFIYLFLSSYKSLVNKGCSIHNNQFEIDAKSIQWRHHCFWEHLLLLPLQIENDILYTSLLLNSLGIDYLWAMATRLNRNSSISIIVVLSTIVYWSFYSMEISSYIQLHMSSYTRNFIHFQVYFKTRIVKLSGHNHLILHLFFFCLLVMTVLSVNLRSIGRRKTSLHFP